MHEIMSRGFGVALNKRNSRVVVHLMCDLLVWQSQDAQILHSKGVKLRMVVTQSDEEIKPNYVGKDGETDWLEPKQLGP